MKIKYYFSPEMLKHKSFCEIFDEYESYKKRYPIVKFCINYNLEDLKSENFEFNAEFMLNSIIEFIGSKDIILSIQHDTRNNLTVKDLKKLKNLEEKYKSENILIGIEDFFSTWTISDVEKANASIKQTANEIREQHFSPYEKLLDAFLRVTNKKYLASNDEINPELSRSIYGVLNSDKIVCAGFSSLMVSILNEIGDDNIKLFRNYVKVEDNAKSEKTEYHENLIVYIKDEKYKKEGFYYLDPTWDSIDYNKSIRLKYFLIPIQDINLIKHYNIVDSPLPKASYLKGKVANGKYVVNAKNQEEYISFGRNNLILNKQFENFLMSDATIKHQISSKMFDSEIERFEKNQKNNFDRIKQIQNYYLTNGWQYVNKDVVDFKVGNLIPLITVDKHRSYVASLSRDYLKDEQIVFLTLSNIISEYHNKEISKLNGSEKEKRAKHCHTLIQRINSDSFKRKVYAYGESDFCEEFEKLCANGLSLKSKTDVDNFIAKANKILSSKLFKFDDEYCNKISYFELTSDMENQILSNSVNEEYIRKYLKQNNKFLYEIISQRSTPFELGELQKALYVVKKKEPKLFERISGREQFVDKILDDNIDNIDYYFNQNAKNSFAQSHYYDEKEL